MIGELTQALVTIAQSPQGGYLSTLQAWADIVQKTAATVAIVGTAGWAYFKFVRGRTFRRRVELTISGEVRRGPGIVYLLTNSTTKNIGLSKFEIDHEKSGLRVMTHASEGAVTEPRLAEWQPLSTWPVFEGHGLLEPGEPAAEETSSRSPTRTSPPSGSSSGSPRPKTSRGR